MSNEELYWLVGWLEGEGSFIGGSPSQASRCSIRGSSTDKDIIEKVCSIMGGNIYEPSTRPNSKPHWKKVYSTSLEGIPARNLMIKLKPLMGSRRQQQIQKALDSYNPTITPEKLDEVKRLTKEGFSCRKIAKMLDISHGTVSNINRNKHNYDLKFALLVKQE